MKNETHTILMEVIASIAELRGMIEKLELRMTRLEQGYAIEAVKLIEERLEGHG